MDTLNGFCSAGVIAHHAACARQRLAATGATTLFVATMHARDRHTLTRALNDSARVVHVTGALAERVETGAAWQEDARVVDTWLLSQGVELLLSPASTMGYLAMAVARPHTRLTMLRTCEPAPSREASYHMLKQSIAYRRPPGSRHGAKSCRSLADEYAHGTQVGGEERPASARLRAFWNASIAIKI